MFAIGSAVALLALAAVGQIALPDPITVHWNAAGDATRTGSRLTLIFMAIAPIAVWLVLEAALRALSEPVRATALTLSRLFCGLTHVMLTVGVAYSIAKNLGAPVPPGVVLVTVIAGTLAMVGVFIAVMARAAR